MKLMNDFNPKIDPDRVIAALGYPSGAKASAKVLKMVSAQVAAAESLVEPRVVCVGKEIAGITGQGVELEGGTVFKSAVLARALAKCSHAFVFAATIGRGLEDRVAAMMKGDASPEGLVLDTVGSEAAEGLADKVSAHVASFVKPEGLAITQRFSPGYCDWDVAEQTVLFAALGREHTGITLNSSCQMIPRKSVSGVIGAGLPEKIGKAHSPCRACPRRKTCDWARPCLIWVPGDDGR